MTSFVTPVPAHHETYEDLMKIYAARERAALVQTLG